MNQINELPDEEYDFGKTFDYAVWTANTTLTLANVPWDSAYRDIVRFTGGHASLNAYIDSMSSVNAKIESTSRARFNQPIAINIPFNRANRYNYIRASNPIQPVPGVDVQKDYYYFITSMEDVAPNTTRILVQLDVWQTFGYDVQFKQCYIERGHIGVANSKQFDNFGRDYLTNPEGLDVGGEYRIIATNTQKIMTPSPGSQGLDIPGIPTSEPGYDVLVCSTTDLLASGGSATDPVLTTASGGMVQGLAAGADFWVFKGISGFLNYMSNNKNKPWITQGIVSITLIPRITRYLPGFNYGATNFAKAPALGMPTKTYSMLNAWRTDPNGVVLRIPSRYKHLKKFFTSPYMMIEMTTWTGQPIAIKPESWANDNAVITETISILPPGQRVEFSPQRYNAAATGPVDKRESFLPDIAGFPYPHDLGDADDNGEYMDFVTRITNFPQMAIVNNGAIAYLASNTNQIAFQHSNADWSYSRNMQGAGNANSNSSLERQLASSLNQINTSAASRQAQMANQTASDQAVIGGIGGVASGAVSGGTGGPIGAGVGAGMGGLGAVASALSNGVSNAQRSSSTALSNITSYQNVTQQNQTGEAVATNNYNLAQRVNSGDYQQQIAGINARVQDANLIQPTSSGQLGGEAANLINDRVGVSLRWKLIDPAAIRRVGDYWLRYGYSVLQWAPLPADLTCMSNFTYWKLSETYLAGMIPEGFKNSIRGIFEKGVTVWSDPVKIGAIDIADNEPKAGISLP